MYSSHFAAIVLAMLVLASPTPAQTQVSLRSGDWLRVQTVTGERTTGTLLALDDERVRLETTKGPVGFPLAEVERLDLSVGRRRALSAFVGAGIGLIGGVVFGAALSASGSGSGGANMAVIGLPLLTIPAGAVLGAMAAPHRYLTVEQPYRLQPR